jgi:hypothetical protein
VEKPRPIGPELQALILEDQTQARQPAAPAASAPLNPRPPDHPALVERRRWVDIALSAAVIPPITLASESICFYVVAHSQMAAQIGSGVAVGIAATYALMRRRSIL